MKNRAMTVFARCFVTRSSIVRRGQGGAMHSSREIEHILSRAYDGRTALSAIIGRGIQ